MKTDIYKSKIWISDLDDTLQVLPELVNLENKTILVTGASGLIGSSVVDILIRYNEIHNSKINILALGRSQTKMKERFGKYFSSDYFSYFYYDASALDFNLDLGLSCDYIIHAASNAFPDSIMREPVETMMSNFLGTFNLLNYARKHNVNKLLFVSSSEIYGQKVDHKPYLEGEYGYIDLLNIRNSYSIGKCAAETLCVSYEKEYGVKSVVVRPGHIYGPTASSLDNRVSSMWAYSVARGEDIVMKSDGSQLRSYCYCLDCASAIFKILFKGESCNAYNISNPDSVLTIKDMALLLSSAGNVNLIQSIANDGETKCYNPMVNSSLDSLKIQELGWKGIFSAEKGFRHTVFILKEII